ncbi:hypothetical protein CSUB_C0035 [Candidatus Caldarchaeum subterraneum]|uniref:Uncharacterized protein n=1 Tax=Caldiarchaeum subterraneum TaxID=311458 RepID=E6N3A8_CALS0|nr:hypothetical protein HGMM_F29E04C20 [Candidatus Caldarchaeum subterraneum]BAJ49901.1 hypothetical protein CSUB_C0035 [Candidatus Caldarchaeum subterraneum]
MKKLVKPKTLHELAKILIQIGELMQSLPDFNLVDIEQPSKINEQREKEVSKNFLAQPVVGTDDDISAFVSRMRQIKREEAEKMLSALTYKKLKLVVKTLGLPVGERKNKDVLIRKILWHLFDFEKGHKLLRNGES